MPYIPQVERKKVDVQIDALVAVLNAPDKRKTAGTFTYVVYKLLGGVFYGRYWLRALGLGCMLSAILEWYRTDFADYEERKREENGDV